MKYFSICQGNRVHLEPGRVHHRFVLWYIVILFTEFQGFLSFIFPLLCKASLNTWRDLVLHILPMAYNWKEVSSELKIIVITKPKQLIKLYEYCCLYFKHRPWALTMKTTTFTTEMPQKEWTCLLYHLFSHDLSNPKCKVSMIQEIKTWSSSLLKIFTTASWFRSSRILHTSWQIPIQVWIWLLKKKVWFLVHTEVCLSILGILSITDFCSCYFSSNCCYHLILSLKISARL